MSELTLALDVGGTKIAAGLVDADGTLVHHAQQPTPDGDAEAVWAVAETLITEALRTAGGECRRRRHRLRGPDRPAERHRQPDQHHAWQRFPIVERVAAADRWAGAARRRRTVHGARRALARRRAGTRSSCSGMVVSTGIGGGLVLDGAPYDGRTGNAGHVGHVVVDPDGAPCTCGGHGCVETIASGPHMARWAREHGWDAPPDADAKELADAANARRSRCAARHSGAERTAVAATIASVAAVCDLDLVVIGGGVAKSGALLFDPLREALAYAGLDFLRELRVVPAELGGDAGLVGAAGWHARDLGALTRVTRLRRDGIAQGSARRVRAFWLIGRRARYSFGFHRRPSVTEKSVEGPGKIPAAHAGGRG